MTKQIAILVENRPGAVAEVTDILGKADVNIEGIMLEGSLEFGVLRIHASPLQKAIKALTAHEFQVTVGDVIVVNLDNRPGRLSKVLHTLARAEVNVESIFGTTWGLDKAKIVLRVDDAEHARQALKGEGVLNET